MEASVTLIIIVFFWILLTVADLFVCLILRLTLKVPFKRAFLRGMLSLLVPPVVIAYGTLVERNRFEVKEVVLEFDDLPESFNGYRIVHLSDIHARSFSRRAKQMQKAVDRINGTDPDLVAFTGDLITLTPDEIDPIALSLRNLKVKDGVVSVLGNHDYGIYADTSVTLVDDLIAKERDMGWTLLMNEHKVLHRGLDSIVVIGVENTSSSHFFPSNGDLTKATEGTEGAFRIVLTHDPLHWESEILGQDYPLTLSGHTHAMQLSLFGWSPSSLMFKHSDGLYTSDDGNQHLYVNVGLGETIFPARIGARPEITLITLKKTGCK
jgi:predicted MPP superfamily phosphohydrolase